MKAIFLDVDGVLVTERCFMMDLYQDSTTMIFDPVSLAFLKELVDNTGAEIILSSSWRDAIMTEDPDYHGIIENLFDRLRDNGTPIADVTPLVWYGQKGEEIRNWLQCNPCEAYVIFDDNDMFSTVPEVRKHWIKVDESNGLTGENYAEALEMLSL